jgi:hypothetical protein
LGSTLRGTAGSEPSSESMAVRRRRCRGPSGVGCFRNICRRAVLDSNCFRGSPLAEIEALRRRGFQLSLSHEALREVWARSLREDNKALLQQRIALIAPLLDPEHPVAFSGGLLLSTLGPVPPEVHAEDERLRDSLRLGWEDACAGITDERWRKELDDELEREATGWLKEFERFRSNLDRIIEVRAQVGHDWYPKRRTEQVIENQIKGPAPLEPPAAQRLHLARRLLAIKASAYRERQPKRNDFVDWRLLIHVAWPAFLVTSDFKFIEAVDATKSLQRAWVRAPVEMIEDPIYRCEPWGKPGHWVGDRFCRQDLKELRARQDEMRRRFEGISRPRHGGIAGHT